MLLLLLPNTASAAIDTFVNGGSGSNAERQIVRINNQMRGYLQMLVAKEYDLDPRASQATMQAALDKYNETKRWIASGDANNDTDEKTQGGHGGNVSAQANNEALAKARGLKAWMQKEGS